MTTMANSVLSDGPDGVAPQSGLLRVLVEGWMFRPHSYSLVNQYQCLEMLKRDDVVLFHREHELIPMIGEPVHGLLDRESETALRTIPLPRKGAVLDAIYRIGYPYNFGPGEARTFVFATCERMRVQPDSWVGGSNLAETIEKNDITVITPSEWSRRGFIATGVNPERVVVVPHGVDTSVFRPLSPEERVAERKRLGCSDRFIFLNVSAMTGNKNIGGTIEAFARVVRDHPRAGLVCKGIDSMYRSSYWMDSELSGVEAYLRWKASKNMTYMGNVLGTAALAKVYQTADAYITPYKSEGFNLPVLEAMACGLPVIVTDGGCTDEFVTEEALKIPSVCADFDGKGTRWLKTEVADIQALMERAMNQEVAERSLRAGPDAARAYSWKAVTGRLLSVMATSLKGDR